MLMPEWNTQETKEQIMRKLILSTATLAALAGTVLLTAPAIATPVSGLGALNAAAPIDAAAVDNVEQAAFVCGRWRCWNTWGGPRRYWGGYGYYGRWGHPWRRHWWHRF
jgi:hypothetical protein